MAPTNDNGELALPTIVPVHGENCPILLSVKSHHQSIRPQYLDMPEPCVQCPNEIIGKLRERFFTNC